METEDWKNEGCSSASESTTLPSWKLSNDSFCQSLSNTLQTLTTEQQVSCRIDILVAIEKYMSSTNGDGSNSTNFTPSSIHSRLDTLASDMSKRFAEILSKINNGSISSLDEDWLIVFATKNFFCKLLEMRKINPELDELLPSLASVDTAPQIIEEHGRRVISVPRTTAELKKPVCMNRRSALSRIGGKNKPQPSSMFNPEAATSAKIKTDLTKTRSADCAQFHSSESVSQNSHNLPQSGQNVVNPASNPIHQMGIHHHNPFQSWFNSNPAPASLSHVETCSIKSECLETDSGSSEPFTQNFQSVPNSTNSNCITLQPSLVKHIPKSAPTVTPNEIHLRPTANVRSVSTSAVDIETLDSTVNSGLSNSASDSHVSSFPACRSIPERTKDFENAVRKTLKNINSIDSSRGVNETLKKINSLDSRYGFMQFDDRNLCVFCDIWFPSDLYREAHTRDPNHVNYASDYFRHCTRLKKTALPKLDKSLYVIQSNGLLCVQCNAQMKHRISFVSHMKTERHKNLSGYVDVDARMIGSIDQVIVSIGSFDYCVLCNVKLFDCPPAEHISSAIHQREIALLKGIFKIDRHAYCSYCNEKFLQTALTLHVNNEKHISMILRYDSR